MREVFSLFLPVVFSTFRTHATRDRDRREPWPVLSAEADKLKERGEALSRHGGVTSLQSESQRIQSTITKVVFTPVG